MLERPLFQLPSVHGVDLGFLGKTRILFPPSAKNAHSEPRSAIPTRDFVHASCLGLPRCPWRTWERNRGRKKNRKSPQMQVLSKGENHPLRAPCRNKRCVGSKETTYIFCYFPPLRAHFVTEPVLVALNNLLSGHFCALWPCIFDNCL